MLVGLINLDRSTDRLQTFTEVNRHLSEVVRFAAIDGRQQDVAALLRDGVIQEAILKDYTAGALGLALSHLSLWKQVVDADRTLTICEDDAIFHHAFEEKAPAVIARLPADWDVVLWGWNFDAAMVLDLGISTCVVFGDEERLNRNAGGFQSAPAEPHPMRLNLAFGTQCYSVSPKGARALLEFCLPIRPMHLPLPWPQPGEKTVLRPRGLVPNSGVDVMMSLAYPSLQAFACVPPLVVSNNEKDGSTVARDTRLSDLAGASG